jgi:Ca2+/H+ antiporter, TMEM165/GDT1 family
VGVAAITFGLVFLAELVDTSALATLVLGARFPPRWVLLGVCAGMLVHVVVAVLAGSLVALLPHRPLAAVLAVVFLVGAVLLIREEYEDDDEDEPRIGRTPRSAWGVVATAFGVTVLSELADPSEIVIASLAARYAAPLVVGVSAVLALWAVSALAVYGGNRLERVVPVRWVTRLTAALLVGLAAVSAVQAVRG